MQGIPGGLRSLHADSGPFGLKGDFRGIPEVFKGVARAIQSRYRRFLYGSSMIFSGDLGGVSGVSRRIAGIFPRVS